MEREKEISSWARWTKSNDVMADMMTTACDPVDGILIPSFVLKAAAKRKKGPAPVQYLE